MKPEELTRKVCIVQCLTYGSVFVSEYRGPVHKDYLQLTEPVEVTFTELQTSEVIEAAVANIDAKIQQVRADASDAVMKLEQRKAELLALPAPGAV